MSIAIVVKDSSITVSVTVPGETPHTYTPTGGITVGGTAVCSHGRSATGSGGITVGGSADVSRGYAYTPRFSNIAVGGSAPAVWAKAAGGGTAYVYEGVGGIDVGGSAACSSGHVHDPSGGITVGGAAPVRFETPSVVFDSQAPGFVYTPSGGIEVGGEGVAESLPAGIIYSEELPPICLGVDYAYQLQGLGSDQHWSILSGLPEGLTVDVFGFVSGNTSLFANLFLKVQLESQGYAPVQKYLAYTPFTASSTSDGPLTMVTEALPSGTTLAFYLFKVQFAGGTIAALECSVDSQFTLPPGLDIMKDGTIFGLPLHDGTYSVKIQATDGTTSIEKTVNITIATPSQISITTDPNLPVVVVGQPWLPVTLVSVGSSGPFIYSIVNSTVPPGFTLTPEGKLGVDTNIAVPGNYTFTIQSAHFPDVSGSQTFNVQVIALSAYVVVPSGGIVIGGSAPVTHGMIFQPSGGAQVGGSAPAVFVAAAGAAAYSYQGSGGATVGGSATSAYTPVSQPGTATLTLSDGTVITLDSAGAGTDTLYTTGLGAGSANAPRGTNGLRLRCLLENGDIILEIRNTGRKYPGSGVTPTNSNGGQPVYVRSLTANMPGRMVPYGAKYRSVRDLGGGVFNLIDPNDPKIPELSVWITQDPAAYTRTKTEHYIPGGLTIQYRFVPISDPIERSKEPSQALRDQAIQLIDIATETIAQYPFADSQIQNFQDDGLQDNPNLGSGGNRAQTKESFLMEPANLAQIATGVPAVLGAGAAKLRTWVHGMSIFTPQTGFNTDGHYSGNAFWFVNYLLHPTQYYDSFARGLGLLRQSIACGLYRSDVACKHKDRWCPEGTEIEGGSAGQVHMRGTDTGWTEPIWEKEWDLACVLGHLLRPDDSMITEAFNRRVAVMLAIPITTSYTSLAGDQTTQYGSRRFATMLHNVMWYYRYFKITAGLSDPTALALKAKADTIIEALYQAGHAIAYPDPPRWIVHTTGPAVSPGNAGDHNISGAGEGIWHIIAKWMVDVGTNPTRLQWLKDGVEWMLLNCTQVYAPGKRRLCYRWTPNLTGGALFPNVNLPPVTIDYASNSTLQQAHIQGLKPYVSTWFSGAYDSYFTEMIEAIWNDHNTPANTGALAFDDTNWPKLHRMKVQHLMLAHIGG